MKVRDKFFGILLPAITLVWLNRPLYAQDKKEGPAQVFQPEITGYFYYYHDLSSGDSKTNSFDFSRVYVGARYRLSDKFTFRYLSDIMHDTGGGKLTAFAKYAYLDWKLNPSVNLLLGLQATLNFKVPEKVWGYRVIRKAPMESFGDYWTAAGKLYLDRLDQRRQSLASSGNQSLAGRLEIQKENFAAGSRAGMSSSADQGAALSLKPNKRSYLELMLRNGTGYKKSEDDRYKDFDVRGGAYFLDNNALHLSAFLEVEPWEGKAADGAVKTFNNLQWDLFASYTVKARYSIGADVNAKRFPGSYENITAWCYSVFGNVDLVPERLKALGRFDYYRSGFDATPSAGPQGLKTNASLYILGLDYLAAKGVHFIPNFQVLSYEDSNINANNGFYIHLLVEL